VSRRNQFAQGLFPGVGVTTTALSGSIDVHLVTHEQARPLASAKAAVESLRSREIVWTDEEGEELLATAHESLERLDRLVARVLVNVIANTARHSPPGEPVLVTASAHADRMELRVIDRGPGIPRATATASSCRSSGWATATTTAGSASAWRCPAG
jgi:K+-sensing histidine kinase KdpD